MVHYRPTAHTGKMLIEIKINKWFSYCDDTYYASKLKPTN